MEVIRKEFTKGVVVDGITDWPGLDVLCERHGLDIAEVTKTSIIENWAVERRESRKKYQAETVAQIRDQARKRVSSSALDYADALDEAVAALRRHIMAADDPRDLAAIVRAAPAIGQEIARLVDE